MKSLGYARVWVGSNEIDQVKLMMRAYLSTYYIERRLSCNQLKTDEYKSERKIVRDIACWKIQVSWCFTNLLQLVGSIQFGLDFHKNKRAEYIHYKKEITWTRAA